ncbi:hypothetical protein [Rhizobium sp. 2MFCol3.1]|uniref:hypothetical protein n=1 Tax=Rhizobium sp. 2MFCol3.1 TaxID=1246459 RepID=UPI00036EA0CC|nr:hypothetical protein [Rhizobium sp. 2MFCol3.1]
MRFCIFSVRVFAQIFILVCNFFICNIAYAQSNDAEKAFEKFIRAEDYKNASFYLETKLVDPAKLDVSQMFFNILMDSYYRDMKKNAVKIDTLYQFLSSLGTVDLNKTADCYNDSHCLLANELMYGASPDAVKYFVDRGLNLNHTDRGIIPASMPFMVRLGSVYNVEDMNFFAKNGLVLGDELYPIEQLSNYRDNYLYSGRLNMPENYLELSDQNLLDVAVIALGSSVNENSPKASIRRKVLCDFVTYAASSFTPSFDYLLYLLKVSNTFRGEYVGKTEKSGNSIYQPFPSSCVSLVQSMAASHAQLQSVISDFANNGDVKTAQWLISIKQGQN